MKNYCFKVAAFYRLNGFLVNLFILLFLMTISLFVFNRAFGIGSFMAIIFLLAIYKRIKFNKKTIAVVILLIALLTTSLAFLVKSDSTLGRILIYKVSWNMFADNFLTGIGFGEFQINYNLYQSAYFRTGHFTEKEFLLADSVFFTFNDYWQFIIEFGLIGLIMLIVISLLIVKTIKKMLNANPLDSFIKLIVSLLLVIFTAALFTHVFEKEVFQVFIVISLAWFVYIDYFGKPVSNINNIIFIIFSLGFVVFRYANDIMFLSSYNKFEKAKLLSANGYKLESQKLYNEVYPKLKNDAGFLIYYCDEFFDYKDSKLVLKDYLLLSEKRTDYRVYLKLALIYERLKQNHKAEETYLKAIYMVPNRFSSRLELFNFYLSAKKNAKAKALGEITLKMPIKIPSPRIILIKKEIEEKINEINSYR